MTFMVMRLNSACTYNELKGHVPKLLLLGGPLSSHHFRGGWVCRGSIRPLTVGPMAAPYSALEACA